MKRLALGIVSLLVILISEQAWAEFVPCLWGNPEYPHISSSNKKKGDIDIKTAAIGECPPSSEPFVVAPQMFLEVEEPMGSWSTYKVGDPIPRPIQGTGAFWKRSQLAAVETCKPGKYRGKLIISAQNVVSGAVVYNDTFLSPEVKIDCKLKQDSMVIDDTGSMSDDIARIRTALTSHVNSQPEDEYNKWNLITFKDSPSNVITTEDRGEILSSVSSLTASGGGDCPEDVLGGISAGLSALGNDPEHRRQMFVATDAAAKVGDVDGIIAEAQKNGVNVNVLLRGDCDFASVPTAAISGAADTRDFVSSQVVLKRIAEETGGKYFFLPNGTDDQIKAAVKEIFDTFTNPPPPPSPPATPNPAPTPSPAPSPSSDGGGGGCILGRTGSVDAMLPVLFVVACAQLAMKLFRQKRFNPSA